MRKIKSSAALEVLVQENFPFVKSLKKRNRGNKLYLKVELMEWSLDNHQRMMKVKDALRDYYPRIYMTSFGGQTATFRLNNADFLLD